MLGPETEAQLERNLSKHLVLFYGLGTILGAGIYVLVGKVAAKAGIYTPFAFLLASIIAGFTAVSYAELSARFPKSAGEAYYVEQAFGKKLLSSMVGWLVVFTGIISTAAMSRGFAGYAQVFLALPSWGVIMVMIAGLSLIAIWGIKESVLMMMGITCIEILGLLIIIFLGFSDMSQLSNISLSQDTIDWAVISGVLSGAFLAFYSYIGFEDMVNVAEEVYEPEKSLPPAIFGALIIAAVIYFLVASAMILAMPIEKLTNSAAPLADFIQQKGYSPVYITLISFIAILNGALAQIIMASRVIYGMARQNHAPLFLGKVNAKTRTPIISTVLVSVSILVFALVFDIERLANLTTSIILCIFTLVNLALIWIKYKMPQARGQSSYSMFFPVFGALLSILFLTFQFLF